jgi:hypothetical protein
MRACKIIYCNLKKLSHHLISKLLVIIKPYQTLLMKLLISFAVAVLVYAIVLPGCMKKVATIQPENSDIPPDIINQIKADGFSTRNIQKVKDGYLVEGDILLTENEIAHMPKVKSLNVGNVEQYRTNNLIQNRPRILTVSIDPGFPPIYSTATDEALVRYSIGLDISFLRVNGAADINIVPVNLLPNPDGTITLGASGFPDANGEPFHTIQLNINALALGNNPEQNYCATTIAHEMGHCIGFRHTDYFNRASCGGIFPTEGDGGVGAWYITGTFGNVDPDSWMLACNIGGINRPFDQCDVAALQFLYGSCIGGEGQKRIDGYCETGNRVNTNCEFMYQWNEYDCTYHYEWSDGTISQDYHEWNVNPCLFE